MFRKLALTLIVSTLLLSTPVVLIAQDGAVPQGVSLATDTLGLDHVTAKHGAEADPNGDAVKVASQPAFDLFGWMRLFLRSVLPL